MLWVGILVMTAGALLSGVVVRDLWVWFVAPIAAPAHVLAQARLF